MLYVQKLLGDTENDLHEEAIVFLASIRFTWRKFVVVYSAAECGRGECTLNVKNRKAKEGKRYGYCLTTYQHYTSLLIMYSN